MTPKLVVLHSCKKLQVLIIIFLTKKFLQLICTDKILKIVCRNLFEITQSRDISTLGDFTVPKNCSSQ